MPSFNLFLKICFLSGSIGTAITVPIFWLADVTLGGGGGYGQAGLAVEILMLAVGPLLMGFGFALCGALAYPIVRLLHSRGILADLT